MNECLTHPTRRMTRTSDSLSRCRRARKVSQLRGHREETISLMRRLSASVNIAWAETARTSDQSTKSDYHLCGFRATPRGGLQSDGSNWYYLGVIGSTWRQPPSGAMTARPITSRQAVKRCRLATSRTACPAFLLPQ